MRIEFKGRKPIQAKLGDAGYDLFADEDSIIPSMERRIIKTGTWIALPVGYEGQIRSKSGLASNDGLMILNSPGTIDAGYRGEIMAIVFNSGKNAYHVKKDKKICQIVFNAIPTVSLVEVSELPSSERGEGGLGSTGL
jgi:dUTP pyrophosphatase